MCFHNSSLMLLVFTTFNLMYFYFLVFGFQKRLKITFNTSVGEGGPSLQRRILFISLLLRIFINFISWGERPFTCNYFILCLRLILYIRSLVIISLKGGYKHYFSKSESFVGGISLFFIHLLSDLMKPTRVFLRILINISLGHSLLINMSGGLMEGLTLTGLSLTVVFVVYECLVILIQSFVYTFIFKLYIS